MGDSETKSVRIVDSGSMTPKTDDTFVSGRKKSSKHRSIASGSTASSASARTVGFGPPATAEKSAAAKSARDFSRNVRKRGTHIIVKTFFPTRFRPMKEKEYELKVQQQAGDRLLEKRKRQEYQKKDKLKSFAAQRASVRRFLNDVGFRRSISGTFLDNSDAFRRKRDEMEEAEPEPPSDEVLEEERKIDEDNAWIVKTLEEHDTREDLEQRVIQHIMQDPRLFTTLRNILRVAEGNRQRHRQVLEKQISDLEQVSSSVELFKATEQGLAQAEMRERLWELRSMLQAARTSQIPKHPATFIPSYTPRLSYWDSDGRFKESARMEASLEEELLSNLKIHGFNELEAAEIIFGMHA